MKISAKSLASICGVVFGVWFMIVPFASATEKPLEKREWALLTYLNGFNSLDSFGYLDMNEMEAVGSSPRVHVVSQWASLQTKQVHRIYVNKDADPKNVTSPVVQNLGQIDMGDYRSLIDFVVWAAKAYPADHYFVNVWNHGNGWHFRGSNGGISARDLSYDDLSGNHITTEQLGIAMAEIAKQIGKPVDLLGSDSCLMAMAEVVGEIKGSVGAFVGSQEVEPADGWPYDALLRKWNEGGAKSPTDVSGILTKAYVDSYPSGRQATLAGMDLRGYPALAQSVRELSIAIKALPAASRGKVLQAAGLTQSYTNDDYRDLGDFVDQLGKDASISIRPETLAGVRTAIRAFVTSNHTTTDMARSHGVSIWLPAATWQFDTYKDRYRALAFNQDTAWIDAVAATVSAIH